MLRWTDKLHLARFDPSLAIRSTTAFETSKRRKALLANPSWRQQYLADFRSFAGMRSFLASGQNYPLNRGNQPNLYKCFIERSFGLARPSGIIGLLHPGGHFTGTRDTKLRQAIYGRLAFHFHFRNSIKARMFADIDHHVEYSVNIYRGKAGRPDFRAVFNLFLPQTLDACFEHDGIGDAVPAIKDERGQRDLRGHAERIIDVDPDTLSIFAALMEGPDYKAVLSTRMPAPHSQKVLNVLEKLSRLPERLASGTQGYVVSSMWHETGAQKSGRIRREPGFRSRPEEVVLTGPNFFVANPLAKSPRQGATKADFEPLHLEGLPEDYLPRSVYRPGDDIESYRQDLPVIPWDEGTRHTDYYRVFLRRRVNATNERTLIPALYPPGIAHVDAVESAAFASDADLLTASALWSSLPMDFQIKVSGFTHVKETTLNALPWVTLPDTARFRALQLCCLTSWYRELWNRNASRLEPDPWTSDDVRLPDVDSGEWSRISGLRTDYARRQAELEIDVLVAVTLGLTFEDLVQVYRMMFPVLEGYDRDTWYDRNGRIVWTCRSSGTVGLANRKEWDRVRGMAEGRVARHFSYGALPGGPVACTTLYEAPFTLPDRIRDYRRAWEVFYPKFAKG